VAHYDVPLYEQVVSRIHEQIAPRLGAGPLQRDHYYIIPFAYQNRGNDPEFSHSFMTLVRVFKTGSAPSPGSEFKTGTYKAWSFEAFNISWLPADFPENPHLCVFSGFGARIFPKMNRCPISPGKNFSLQQTLQLAANAKVAVGMWGPYEIEAPGFDLGVKRKRLLDAGQIRYRADDRLYRKDHVAINCFHALASIEEPFPNGGAFGTGFKMWGLNGTRRVLIEYKERANRRHLLRDPVDEKRDLYGFVYQSSRGANHGAYNPFEHASAYGE
jgi:hypothetical protein